MSIYKKCTAKLYSFLVNDTTWPPNSPLHFRHNLLEIIYIAIMTTDEKIRDEKLQYKINREATKLSALSSGKIGKYEYLTDYL